MSNALRTSLIWHDEVMADVVHERPAPVTLGADSSATFVTPELALPPNFSIVTPGRRGYLLTLSTKMGGTICLGGVEHDVATFVAAGDEGSGFHATTLGPDDWGVITLDGSGDHKFFFQFVPHEVEDWNLGHPMILAGVAGYALSVLALTLFWWHEGVAFGEAAFRGASIASLAIGFAAIVRWAFRQNNGSRASLAFSVLLHSAILLLTFQLYEKESPAVWPGPKSMTGTYLVRASDPPPEPEHQRTKTIEDLRPATATITLPPDHTNHLPPTTLPWEHKAKATLPKTKEKDDHKRFGQETPIARSVGLLEHTALLDDIAGDRGVKDVIQDMKKIKGDGGDGDVEYGAGDGSDTKGGDKDGKKGPIGTHVKKAGALDVGPPRAAECVVNCGGGGGPVDVDPPATSEGGQSLSKEEIAKVMVQRQGLFRACFQVALDHGNSKGGDLVLRFVIDGNGKVTSSGTVGGNISATVATCVKQKLTLLQFPKHGGAIVSHYPFLFSSE